MERFISPIFLIRETLIKGISFLILWILFGQTGISQSASILENPVAIVDSIPRVQKWHFLKESLKDKSIVALGESLHGVKEYNEDKLEIIKFLHEEMGFNVIAVESDLALNYFGNKFIGQVTDSLLLQKLFYPVWHTKSYLELIHYLKNNPSLKVIGFDIANIDSYQTAREDLALVKSPHDTEDILSARYEKIKERYTTEEAFFKYSRDSIMAANIKWIIETLYPGEKVIISAANAHIAKVRRNNYCMGELLAEEYGTAYFPIGFFHSLGNPAHLYRDVFYENDLLLLPHNSLQFKSLELGHKYLFFDFANLKRTANTDWIDHDILHVIQTKKFGYNINSSQSFEYTINLSKSFEAMIWTKEVTHPEYLIESKYHWRNKK